MPNAASRLNPEVTKFLDQQNHPLRIEIEQLRIAILNAQNDLTENIKWNGPNYCFHDEDRITMRIQPPKQLQLIFHRGAKKQAQPDDKLITDQSGLLAWKENDRAVATFKNMAEIEKKKPDLDTVIKAWISVTC